MTGQVVLVVWLICGLLGALIGSSKGRTGAGLILGGLLGIIGLIIVAVMKPTPEKAGIPVGGRKCQWCAEPIQMEAVVCKHCGRDVGAAGAWLQDPSERYPDRWWDGTQWTPWIRDKPGGTRGEDVEGAKLLIGRGR